MPTLLTLLRQIKSTNDANTAAAKTTTTTPPPLDDAASSSTSSSNSGSTPVGVVLFLLLVIASRVGLYSFDIGQSQIIQTEVVPARRALVSGLEKSLQSSVNLLQLAVVAAFPSIANMPLLAAMSAAMASAAVLAMALYNLAQNRRETAALAVGA
eukprot:Filipodium_phascolosomae@DN3004_c0_g1_i2.p2